MFDQYSFPSQKKPLSQKNKDWRKRCVNSGENIALYSNESIRKSRYNKAINYDLYSDILHQEDIETICNPLKLSGMHSPGKMQNYPLANPKIDLLLGEEEKRNFDWKVRVINEDAVSEKERAMQKIVYDTVSQMIIAEALDEQDAQRKLAGLKKYLSYEYQDVRETRATWILKHLWEKNRLERLFNKGFKDALISAEEFYQWDIIAGEPVCFRINPKSLNTVRSGESAYVEDSDIIVIEEYYNPGKVIDHYHEYLTPGQIDKIENYFKTGDYSGAYGSSSSHLTLKVDEMLDTAMLTNSTDGYGSAFDSDGNIRVLKVYWKSLRKFKKVKTYNHMGEEEWDIKDENYIIDKSAGEEEEILWLNEWWEGHKIGGNYNGTNMDDQDAIYTKMQPRPVQFRSMENPSKCHPGIVGTIYNTNDNKGVSLMDRLKPYQYYYNMVMYNLELAIAGNWGKIMRINTAEIPEGWTPEMWLYYARTLKAVPYDPFREANKGVATGKLAGSMTQQNPVLDLETGDVIQLYINILQFIEQQASNISGITPQRQGAIQNRETMGGIERAVTQSALSTEYWFAEHDFTKKRVLEIGLETAKHAWKDKTNKKVQYVLDDLTSQIFDLDIDEFVEMDYDIKISNSYNDKMAFDTLKQMAQAALQAGTMNFSQLLEVMTSESISSVRRKIQMSEQEKMDYEQEKMKQNQQLQQQALQAQAQEKKEDRMFQLTMEDKKLQGQITLEQLKAQVSSLHKKIDLDGDGMADEVELRKAELDRQLKEREMTLEVQENEKDRSHEASENEKDRDNDIKKARISKKTPTKPKS